MQPKTKLILKRLLPLVTDHRLRYHNMRFYRYQNKVWYRIVGALIDNMWITQGATKEMIEAMETVDVPIEFTRQSGKTTTVTHTVEEILLFVTKLFNRPIRIGIFAPQTRQAKTDFVRLKNLLQKTRPDLAVVSPEDRRVERELSNAHELVLADGSYVMIYPITSQSKPESESFDLIIIEESQDADDDIVLEQILPMGTSTNAPVLWIGTAGIKICNFYWLVQKGKALVMDWKQIAEDRRRMYELTGDGRHLLYEQKVKNDIQKYGEQSDAIQLPYMNKWLLAGGMYMTADVLYQCRIEHTYDYPELDNGFLAYAEWYKAVPMGRRLPEIDDYQKSHNLSDATITLWREWLEAPHYFGLDTAKQHDQTILKIGREIDGRLTVVRSVEGLRGVNYEDQFFAVAAVLKHFNIVAGGIDSTGQGDFMPDMFERHTSYHLYRVKFSMQSKDIMYKSHYQKAANKKFGYYYQDPAKLGSHLPTAHSSEEFESEMLNLQKSYTGPYMRVQHPDSDDAHDDHPDATVLMGYAYDNYNINSGIKDFYNEIAADERAAQAAAIAEANGE